MGEDRAIAALRHSIENGWQGIFEPDKKHGKEPPAPKPLTKAEADAIAAKMNEEARRLVEEGRE
jgi:hypothetical protein